MRIKGYNVPDWVGKTSYRCYYMPDWDSYLPYQGWSIHLHTNFSEVLVTHNYLIHLVSSLLFSSSTLPSPNNTKLSHPSLTLHAPINSLHLEQYTPSTAYTNYSMHRVQHTPNTAHYEYCIHHILHHPNIDCLGLPPSLSADHVVLYFLHSLNYKSANE